MATAGVAAVLLAAGAGRRMGAPKALLRDGFDVPQLDRAVGALLEGACDTVVVVLGAEADQAERLLDEAGWSEDPAVRVARCDEWAEGMGASLRTGLRSLEGSLADAALVMLVDLPDIDHRVIRRFAELATPTALVRATYAGRPGHPVVIGREHWSAVIGELHGDRGARDYLEAHDVFLVATQDLATGVDVDTPEDVRALQRPH